MIVDTEILVYPSISGLSVEWFGDGEVAFISHKLMASGLVKRDNKIVVIGEMRLVEVGRDDRHRLLVKRAESEVSK